MDYLLATNPVASLPEGFSSLGQHLASSVIGCLTNKVGVELALRLKQPTTLRKLITALLVGVSSLQWISLEQPVLGLLIPVGVFLLFGTRLKSNLKSLFKINPQALTREF